MKDKNQLINDFYKKVRKANKETPKREAFKDLLNRLYSGDETIEKLIDDITLGAEKTVVNIPRKDILHRGSADTLYNKVIIEFENDLKISYKHAKEQLAGYLISQIKLGEGYNFTLIASDLITWKVLAPDISCLDKLETINEEELILNEVKGASFTLTESNSEDFYFWIDRFLFKERKLKATLNRIEESFGYQSNVFIESIRELDKWFNDAKKFGEVQVSYEQWHKFLSIAYGSFDARENIFLVHTYLSIFAKMLAYVVISNDEFIDDDEMKKILDGSIFHNFNISNFVDNDFFHWVNNDRNYKNLKKVFRLIAQEILTFEFKEVDEDILKGVYQELIDIDTRHSLGEYYTPDWLCEKIVAQFNFNFTDKILDPACGSGSFLRSIIHRIRFLNSEIPVEEINNQIYGIDIHPLSVQIAKATLLLAYGKDILNSKKPIHLNVILANTLLAPEGVSDLFGKSFSLQIDKQAYLINTHVLDNVNVFDNVLDTCEDLAKQTMFKKQTSPENFEIILRSQNKDYGLNEKVFESFYKIYQGFKAAKEKGRNGIWKFIISNLYKPYFLSNKFNYIIGNPPWLTYSSVKNLEYQNVLDELAISYDVKPSKVSNYPHLEIAAIFLAYCNNYFLTEKGKLAFVLPRSFFNADHHDNTRSGKAKGFKIIDIWDLNNVSPLFRIPSCVLFTEKAKDKRSLKPSGIRGLSFSGNLPSNNCNLDIAKDKLNISELTWYYIKQGSSSAFSNRKPSKSNFINPYKNVFKQGATIVPRSFFFIELNQEPPNDYEDRIINIKTSESTKKEAKAPWNGLSFMNKMESRFIFRTAISKTILPFAIYNPELVTLPITIEQDSIKRKVIVIHTAEELMNQGYLCASKWFSTMEGIWNISRTEKNQRINSIDYLNWRNKLTEQNLDAPFLVLYNSSAKDANAAVIRRSELDFEFIVDHKAYYYCTLDLHEANYLAAILNSSIPNLQMKDFQSKGLFGARDVHKKILDVYFPKYSHNDSFHKRLSELGSISNSIVRQFINSNPPQNELSSIHLGRYRITIKNHISKEMTEIDKIVKKLLK
jgi:hypothetical protein